MIDVSDLCPKPNYVPICALCAIEGIEDTLNPYGWRKFNQAQRILKHHKPSPTLTKSEVPGSDLPFAGSKRIGDKRAAVISSFPLQFEFAGQWTDAINRIANSVPPLFMKAVAMQVASKMFGLEIEQKQSTQNSYLTILEDAWQQHLAPRQPNAPTIISLFAGCGGSSLGYSMAGYQERLAVEWDNNAVETFRLNFPDVPVYHGDIAKLSVDECLKLSGLQVGELDVLDGSPPCQGFSTAGKRVMDDPRNSLFREYVRLLKGLQPKVLIMENVSGMVKGKMKLIFVEILKELKASGYQVKAWLMNAMYFNVPQSRQRMIFIGVRNDLGITPIELKPIDKPRGIEQGCPYLTGYKINYTMMQGMVLDGTRPWHSSKEPSPTLSKSGNYAIFEDNKLRRFTIAEAARLASFPDAFHFRYDGIERIGNSVPPLFMRAIAKHVRNTILDASNAQ